ncbi:MULTISPECIES: glycosyltransferase [unclassified Pseudodesulfovibrio]|uniref:glycosyltransferase n=1 Tax=unclassified Pseudodesulfovibrio TaxID=2661612 RepID=UPI0013E399C8|nr:MULTISPECIES: glycosyltransferase [unclassified Pseudodesulfovibrio]MCJ2164999.1 glycosyltransferase [Pseudodesulfovibrio sp. S3-i]
MRILHISKYAPPVRGGVETFVRDLAAEQVRQGHDVSILCHQAESDAPMQTDLDQGVTTTRLPILFTAAFAPFSPVLPLHLQKIIRRTRPEIIHLHLPNPMVLFGALLPADIPLVIHWHADVQDSTNRSLRALYPLYRYFEQRCLAKACRVMATSPPYLESSLSLARWQRKCTVVPLGLDLSRYTLVPDCPKPERPLVLGVGRFTFYKGFQHLVRAASRVSAADFVIVGEGPERSGIQREVDRLGLTDRVRLPGAVPDETLHRLLQQATLFCLPSVDRGEAFGVSLLEAMRYGLPLISTAIPGSGTGWVNEDGVTGRVVPPTDPESLARAIQEITCSPGMGARFGQAARTRLEAEFTIDRTAQTVSKIYETAVLNLRP